MNSTLVEALQDYHRDRRHDDVDERSRQEPLPSQIHQLIITKSRQSPAQPEIQIEQQASLRQKHNQADDDISVMKTFRFRKAIDERKIPAAEIKCGGHRRDDYHRRVFSHKKERPAKTGVFSMKAGHQF